MNSTASLPIIAAYYCGKSYSDGSTEVLAMGLEVLHTDPVTFAAERPRVLQADRGHPPGRHPMIGFITFPLG